MAYDMLAKFVPQSELFLNSRPAQFETQSGRYVQASGSVVHQIKRFDPSNPDLSLVKKKEVTKTDEGKLEVLKKREQV